MFSAQGVKSWCCFNRSKSPKTSCILHYVLLQLQFCKTATYAMVLILQNSWHSYVAKCLTHDLSERISRPTKFGGPPVYARKYLPPHAHYVMSLCGLGILVVDIKTCWASGSLHGLQKHLLLSMAIVIPGWMLDRGSPYIDCRCVHLLSLPMRGPDASYA